LIPDVAMAPTSELFAEEQEATEVSLLEPGPGPVVPPIFSVGT
jgi:hypothetical protein